MLGYFGQRDPNPGKLPVTLVTEMELSPVRRFNDDF
jgi:hypothetical protein